MLNAIISTKFLLPYKVTDSQIPEVKEWIPLEFMIQHTTSLQKIWAKPEARNTYLDQCFFSIMAAPQNHLDSTNKLHPRPTESVS